MTQPAALAALRAALEKSGLSINKFAQSDFFGARGISVRQLRYYLSNQIPIPKRLAAWLLARATPPADNLPLDNDNVKVNPSAHD